MIDIQTKMTERALELLCLPEGQPSFLLDIGWGPGSQVWLPGWYGGSLPFISMSPYGLFLPAAVLDWVETISQKRGTIGWALTSALPCWVSVPCPVPRWLSSWLWSSQIGFLVEIRSCCRARPQLGMLLPQPPCCWDHRPTFYSCMLQWHPYFALLQCRCCPGPGHRGRPAARGHGPGNPFQTRFFWWLH